MGEQGGKMDVTGGGLDPRGLNGGDLLLA